MYNVTKIYICTKSQMEIFTPEELTVAEVKDRITINTSIYVSVADGNTSVALDFCRLITDYPVAKTDSWEDFESELTDKLVIGYTCTLPGYIPGSSNPSHPLKVWDILGTLNTFDTTYADCTTEVEGVFALRHNENDLKISIQSDAEDYPDLKNCVPVVNGFICRPIYKNSKLYGLEGSKLCWTSSERATPEIQVLDFNSIGDIVCTDIASTADNMRTVTIGKVSGTTVSLSTPYSLGEYTPIVVLAGMMILPTKMEVLSDTLVNIDLNLTPVQIALAYINYLTGMYSFDSEVAYKTDTVENYLNEQFAVTNSSSCFVIYVKTRRFLIKTEPVVQWRFGYTQDNYNQDSILINNYTGTIKNYHSDQSGNRTELAIQLDEHLYIADYKETEKQLVFTDNDCKHHRFSDITRNSFSMLYITGDSDD